MLYNQNCLNVAKIAGNSKARPELAGVFVTKNYMVATDNFKLVEIGVPKNVKPEDYPKVDGKTAMRGMKPVIINAKYLKDKIKLDSKSASTTPMVNLMAISHIDDNKVEVLSFDKGGMGMPAWLPRISGNYPDYLKVFPTGKPKAEVELNAEYLIEVLEVLGKLNSLKSVKIKVYGKNEPVLIEAKNENQDGRGLVMPLRQK